MKTWDFALCLSMADSFVLSIYYQYYSIFEVNTPQENEVTETQTHSGPPWLLCSVPRRYWSASHIQVVKLTQSASHSQAGTVV